MKKIFSIRVFLLCLLAVIGVYFTFHPIEGIAMMAAMPMMMVKNQGRATRDYLLSRFPQSTVISESFLRMEVLLSNNASVYNFQILANPGLDAATEQKLDKNDIFAVMRIGLFLGQRNNVSNKSNAVQLLPFPCNALLDAATTNVVINDFYMLYNGSLSVKIGTVTFYDALMGLDFLYVPITQQDTVNAVSPYSATAAATPGVVTGYTAAAYPFQNQRNKDCGYIDLDSLLLFSGSAQNFLTYSVPQMAASIQCTSTANRNIIALILKGFICKNAAYMAQLSGAGAGAQG